MKLLTTPLRYPGGKAKAIPQIINYLPSDFSEYREPFIGGGSLFIYLKQTSPHIKFWINDLNYDLYCFWSMAKINMNHLITDIYNLKNTAVSGKDLFQELTTLNLESLSELERGVRFFVLNRITFSGTVDCGGFSQTAFESRFTRSSIERLRSLESLLQDTTITNLDYSQVINHPGHNVFLFLDPPYLTATNSKLYGKKGDLHT
ncbi:MAG TPA: DNA adenine methylase, partial [Allocoleopsis sp.]